MLTKKIAAIFLAATFLSACQEEQAPVKKRTETEYVYKEQPYSPPYQPASSSSTMGTFGSECPPSTPLATATTYGSGYGYGLTSVDVNSIDTCPGLTMPQTCEMMAARGCRWQQSACVNINKAGNAASNVTTPVGNTQVVNTNPYGTVTTQTVNTNCNTACQSLPKEQCKENSLCAWNKKAEKCTSGLYDSCQNRTTPYECTSLALGTKCFWSPQTMPACRPFTSSSQQCRNIDIQQCGTFNGCKVANGACISEKEERSNAVISIATAVLGGVAEALVTKFSQPQTQVGGTQGTVFSLSGASSQASGAEQNPSWWKSQPTTSSHYTAPEFTEIEEEAP